MTKTGPAYQHPKNSSVASHYIVMNHMEPDMRYRMYSTPPKAPTISIASHSKFNTFAHCLPGPNSQLAASNYSLPWVHLQGCSKRIALSGRLCFYRLLHCHWGWRRTTELRAWACTGNISSNYSWACVEEQGERGWGGGEYINQCWQFPECHICVSWHAVASLSVFFMELMERFPFVYLNDGSRRAFRRRGREWKLAYRSGVCIDLITWSWVQAGMTNKCLSLCETCPYSQPVISLLCMTIMNTTLLEKELWFLPLISSSRDLPLVLLHARKPERSLWTSDSLHLSGGFTLRMYYSRVKLNQALLVISHVFRLCLSV